MRRVVLLLMRMALVTTACGGDGTALTTAVATTTSPATTQTTAPPASSTPPPPPPSTVATTTTLPPTTTTEAATTTTTTTTTTTVPTGGPYLVDEGDFFPDPYPGSLQAHGSGCVTGGALLLPDGVWFGFAEALASGTITFDLACCYTGAAAMTKATDDGEEAFDFYIRNMNPKTYPVPIAGSARVWYIDMTSPNVSVPLEIPLAAWPHPGSYVPCPGQYCAVWLYVNGGEATGIVEQYLP